jgi:hypothetical protein
MPVAMVGFRAERETSMTNRFVMIAVAGVSAVALSGCEIVLPIIALVAGNDDPSPDEYYYYGDGYTGSVDVTVESFSGTFYGQPIEMGGTMPDVTASQDYGSAYFALTVEGIEEGEEGEPEPPPPPPDAGRPDPDSIDSDDLIVTLNVCPIEEYASGEAIADPASYVWLSVCDQGYNCLDNYSGQLEISVQDVGGVRRVTASGTWSSGDNIALTLSYDIPE